MGRTGPGCADDLELNASRSAVVENERWKKHTARLKDELRELLRSEALEDEPDKTSRSPGPATAPRARRSHRATREELRLASASACVDYLWDTRGKAAYPRAARSMVAGRPYDRSPRPSVGPRARVPAHPDALLYDATRRDRSRRTVFCTPTNPIFHQICPDAKDITAELIVRREGQRRREEAAAKHKAPRFPAVSDQHIFHTGPLHGAVIPLRVLGSSMEGPRRLPSVKDRDVLITLRIQGATVEQIRLPSAFGGTRAILDHSEFATDLAFKHVVRDDQFDHALDVLNQEAMQWQRQRLKTLVNDLSAPDVHGLDLLTELLLCGVAVFERSAPDIAQDPQWPLSDVACVPTGQGRKLSAAEIFQGKGWWISDRVPSPLPPEITSKILILPPHLSQTWERWLGDAVTAVPASS